jgi:hypothetical protein
MCKQAVPLVIFQVRLVFSPLVNERKMDAWEGNRNSYGSFEHIFSHLSIQ